MQNFSTVSAYKPKLATFDESCGMSSMDDWNTTAELHTSAS